SAFGDLHALGPPLVVAGAHQLLALDGLPVTFAGQLAALDGFPAAGLDHHLVAALLKVARVDARALADAHAAAAPVGPGHPPLLVAGRDPHPLALDPDDRLLPDAVADGPVHRLDPHAVAHRLIYRLDPHADLPLLVAGLLAAAVVDARAAEVEVDVDADVGVAALVGAALAAVIFPAPAVVVVMTIRIRWRARTARRARRQG